MTSRVSEAAYEMRSEQLIGTNAETTRKRQELIDRYLALGKSIQDGTKSIEEFAKEQAEGDLRKEAEAEYDPLSGLLNRRGFFNRFDEKLLNFRRTLHELRKQGQTGTSGCLVLVDLDDFGAINKTYGDSIGDMTLQQTAITLVENVRPNDLIARFGGEEFLIFLPDTKLEGACIVVERIRKALPIQTAAHPGIRQTASFGIVQFPSDLLEEEISQPKFRERLFGISYRGASETMRFAKKEGKNRTAVMKANETIEIITPP